MQKTSKYTQDFNSELRTTLFGVLADSGRSMTRDEIKRSLPSLATVTPQKISSTLTQMYNQGFVSKAKNASGKVVYWVKEEK